jgi:rRNA maturation RNase YbeY
MAVRIMELAKLDFEDNQILSINFVGPKVISKINEQFVAHQGITDVISFDYREEDSEKNISGSTDSGVVELSSSNLYSKGDEKIQKPDLDLHNKLLEEEVAGELFIYPGVAYLEGQKRKKSYFAYEMTLYIVHGVLHLTGEDDLDPVSRSRMRRRERFIMKKLTSEFDLRKIFNKEKNTFGYSK